LSIRGDFQGSYGVLKSMERSLVIFQSGKRFVWLVSMEKENNFPDLIFSHAVSQHFIQHWQFCFHRVNYYTACIWLRYVIGKVYVWKKAGKSLEFYIKNCVGTLDCNLLSLTTMI